MVLPTPLLVPATTSTGVVEVADGHVAAEVDGTKETSLALLSTVASHSSASLEIHDSATAAQPSEG